MMHLRLVMLKLMCCVLSSQSRDWNEELQRCRELPRNSLQERLQRERSLFKVTPQIILIKLLLLKSKMHISPYFS